MKTNFIIMRAKSIIVLNLFLLTITNVYCQTSKVKTSVIISTNSDKSAEGVSVSGRVKESSGQSIPFATVSIENRGKVITSDENGNFSFRNIKPGKYTLKISGVGFSSVTKQITVADKNLNLSFELENELNQLESVNVLGASVTDKVNKQAYNVTAIDAKKLHNSSMDIGQVLDRVTGVRVKETGGVGSNISVSLNGFTGNQVKFFVDGLPMDNFGSSFQLNNIPVNFADRIEIYKGVVPIWLGGDALGGAVNIVSKSSPRTYLDASYSIGSFNTHKTNINTGYTAKSGFAIQLNAFQNYSDNNYWVNVDVADLDTGVYTPMRVKRFHDTYHNETAVFNIGVMGKKYADQLLVGITAGQNKAEIQTGNRMYDVYGGRLRKGNIVQPTLKYIKKNLFTNGLDVQVSGRYNLGEERSIDTTSYRYNWLGVATYTGRGYEVSRRDFSYKNNNGVFSGNVTYGFNEKHSLSLNNMTNTFSRKGVDALDPENESNKQPQITNKSVTGLGYRYDANEKWSNTIFVKNYHQYSHATELLDGVYIDKKGSIDKLGYGLASTYFILPNLQIKGSYEKAYRLPDNNELFGDIEFLTSNPNLKPESSDNINVSGSYNFNIKESNHFNVDVNYTYRNAKDFIRWLLLPLSFTGVQPQQAVNTRDVTNRGIEAEIKYSYKNFFNIGGNITYQNLRNNTKVEPGKTEPSPYYNERIPNMPYLFGNANASFVINNIGKQKNTLTLGYNLLYVKEFYLRWPGQGSADSKSYVPEQYSHSADIVYQMAKGKYNIAFECHNIGDNILYDNFSLQRPSRSFTLKFRYFFNRDISISK